MKNLLNKISSSEKERILEMHYKASNKNYLSENSATSPTVVPVESLPQEFQTFVKQYGLTGTFNQTGQSSSLGEYGYYKGNVSSPFNTSEIKTYEEHKGDYQKCVERRKEYKKIYDNLSIGTQTGKPMYKSDAKMEADKQINQKYPDMEYCGVVLKMQKIVNNK